MIELAPGAEQNELARLLADRIRDNIATKRGRAAFEATHAGVAVVPDDVAMALSLLGLPLGGAPPVSLASIARASSRRALLQVGQALRTRALKIYGLLSHPQLLLRILVLVSKPPY